ncbi:MAG: response regulator [Proteobacteria bacterium]|nr:response regulator [Pseudomonadota bacterium]MBU1964280.1 response regulator [Pseudomonadota bacterium]MBU4583516.1 response regulator [Pseudomonadota bacterium]
MYPTQAALRSEPAYRPHVLLVEDEFSVAKGLEMVMTEEGYDVDLADTGREALHKFWTKDNFDLMVADLRLPDIDGMEVIQRVKEKRPETKVIIITGYPSVSSAVQAAKMGISDYLRKPFTDDEFLTAVGTALKEKGSMEELISETQKDRLIQRQEVIRVLDRAYQNQDFWRELMENGSESLQNYRLSRTAKAAIMSGDLKWIRENVGELTEEQLLFIYKRLEREAW